MNININKVKIFVTIPHGFSDKIRNTICEYGAGIIGNYSYCTSKTKVLGTFKPNDNANPYIDKSNNLKFVKEEKLEFVCDINKVKLVLNKLKEVHPYEEPAIDIVPLIDENYFK